jgi:hypothetical protein
MIERWGGVSSLRNERKDIESTTLGKEQSRWYTWTGLRLIREPLGMSSFKKEKKGERYEEVGQ